MGVIKSTWVGAIQNKFWTTAQNKFWTPLAGCWSPKFILADCIAESKIYFGNQKLAFHALLITPALTMNNH